MDPGMGDFLFMCVAGSHLYGTAEKGSDTDIRGVMWPTREHLFGFHRRDRFCPSKKHALKWTEEVLRDPLISDDVQAHEVREWLNQLLKGSPNFVEMLFVPSELEIVSTFEWRELKRHRELMIHAGMLSAFRGMAWNQVKRIKRHIDWIRYPPQQPDPRDYGLDTGPGGEDIWRDPVLHRKYSKAKGEYDNYAQWREHRNPRRAALEEHYGYDVKALSAVFRLSVMAEELFIAHQVTFPMRDADLETHRLIMDGAVDPDEIDTNTKAWIGNMEHAVSIAPNLRERPDRAMLECVVQELLEQHAARLLKS